MKMNKYILIFTLLISLVGLTCTIKKEETAIQGKVLVGVSESQQDLIQAEADQFNLLYADANIRVAGTSTRDAIVNLLNDSLKMIIIDRPLNSEEQNIAAQAALNLQAVKVAYDALAIVVNRLNPLRRISLESFEDILTGRIKNWHQLPESQLVGPLELVMTGRNSGIYELLQNQFFKIEKDLAISVLLPTNVEIQNYVATHPQAIGVVSYTCFKNPTGHPMLEDSTSAIQELAFAGLDSTGAKTSFKLHQANIHLGRYPLSYPLYIYYNIQKAGLALGFSAFIASAPGQKIILKWGIVPATMPIRIITLKQQE